jgi:hypothetical protein
MILKSVAVCSGGAAKYDQSNTARIDLPFLTLKSSSIRNTYFKYSENSLKSITFNPRFYVNVFSTSWWSFNLPRLSGWMVWTDQENVFGSKGSKNFVNMICIVMLCQGVMMACSVRRWGHPFLRERFGSSIITFWAMSTDLCHAQFENRLYETTSYEVNNEKLLFRALWQSLSLQMFDEISGG